MEMFSPQKRQTNLLITFDGLHFSAEQLKEPLNQFNSNAILRLLYSHRPVFNNQISSIRVTIWWCYWTDWIIRVIITVRTVNWTTIFGIFMFLPLPLHWFMTVFTESNITEWNFTNTKCYDLASCRFQLLGACMLVFVIVDCCSFSWNITLTPLWLQFVV